MGRSAAGVRGIRLAQGDFVVKAAVIVDPKISKLLVVMENGLGKMTPVEQYRFQGRGGTGVKAAQLTAKTGDIVGGCMLAEGDDGDLICISKQGQTIRMRLKDIPSLGRATQGVIIMRMNAKDKVASMSVIMEDMEEKAKEKQQALLEEKKNNIKTAPVKVAVAVAKPVTKRKEPVKVKKAPAKKIASKKSTSSKSGKKTATKK